jgi:hypothetical protein
MKTRLHHFVFASVVAVSVMAAEKSVWVAVPPRGGEGSAGGDCILGWNFQPKKISQALPQVPEGTVVFFYRNGSFIYNAFELGEWIDPDFVIMNGEGFIFRNPLSECVWFTLTGEELASDSVTRNFGGGTWHLIANAYPVVLKPNPSSNPQPNNPTDGWRDIYNWIECISKNCYTEYSLNYNGASGDFVRFWQPRFAPGPDITYITGGDWIDSTRSNQACPNTWSGAIYSPKLPAGYGMWLKPSSYRVWIQKKSGVECPN